MTTQHKMILRMVQDGSVVRWQHLVKPEFFTADYYRETFNALLAYEQSFKKCMSPDTFRMQWPDFTWADLPEDVEWYADELEADYLAAKIKTVSNEALQVADEDPKTVIKLMQKAIAELYPYVAKNFASGVDLFMHQDKRIELISKRRVDSGLSGITSGFALIDEHTNGTQRGEIELYVARPGDGKSLLLLYGAYCAVVNQSKRVSFISPEMTAFEMGVRLDSMQHHVSSMRMQSGRMTDGDIEHYARRTLDRRNGIQFYESFGRGRFTTADIAAIVRNDAPDILMIDGLLLIDPVGEYRDTRMRLVALMEELKLQVVESGCPIRAAHQSNRSPELLTSAKRRERNPALAIPELHHLAESGATEQYANRVLALKYQATERRMYVALRKNRNAPSGRVFSFEYDIDLGYMSGFRLEGDEADGSDVTQSLDETGGHKSYAF